MYNLSRKIYIFHINTNNKSQKVLTLKSSIKIVQTFVSLVDLTLIDYISGSMYNSIRLSATIMIYGFWITRYHRTMLWLEFCLSNTDSEREQASKAKATAYYPSFQYYFIYLPLNWIENYMVRLAAERCSFPKGSPKHVRLKIVFWQKQR